MLPDFCQSRMSNLRGASLFARSRRCTITLRSSLHSQHDVQVSRLSRFERGHVHIWLRVRGHRRNPRLRSRNRPFGLWLRAFQRQRQRAPGVRHRPAHGMPVRRAHPPTIARLEQVRALLNGSRSTTGRGLGYPSVIFPLLPSWPQIATIQPRTRRQTEWHNRQSRIAIGVHRCKVAPCPEGPRSNFLFAQRKEVWLVGELDEGSRRGLAQFPEGGSARDFLY